MYIAQPCAPRAQAAQKLSNLHPSPKCWHDISIGLAGFRQYMLFVLSPRHRNPRRTWQPPWREQHWDWPAASSRESQVRSLRLLPPPLMDSAWSPGEPQVETQKSKVSRKRLQKVFTCGTSRATPSPSSISTPQSQLRPILHPGKSFLLAEGEKKYELKGKWSMSWKGKEVRVQSEMN